MADHAGKLTTDNGGGEHGRTNCAPAVERTANGRALSAGDERASTERGQTSADVKKRRAAQRHNGSCNVATVITTRRDDWRLTASPSVVDKKPPQLDAVDCSSVTSGVKFKNSSTRRCVLM